MAEKPEMNGPEPLRQWPKAFGRLAAKINELCAWFGGISAGPGIHVTKSRARTIISLAPSRSSFGGSTEGSAIDVVGSDGKLNKVPKHSTWATPSTYPTYHRVENSDYRLQFDSSTGILDITRLSNSKKVRIDVSALADSITINSSGIFVQNTSTSNSVLLAVSGAVTITNSANSKAISISPVSLANDITIDSSGIKVTNASSSNYAKIAETGVITVYKSTGTKTLTIDPASISQNMSIREIDVCAAGTSKKMLVLASAPY